jgi:hypothetical protein
MKKSLPRIDSLYVSPVAKIDTDVAKDSSGNYTVTVAAIGGGELVSDVTVAVTYPSDMTSVTLSNLPNGAAPVTLKSNVKTVVRLDPSPANPAAQIQMTVTGPGGSRTFLLTINRAP